MPYPWSFDIEPHHKFWFGSYSKVWYQICYQIWYQHKSTWIGQLSHKFNKLLASNYASKWSVDGVLSLFKHSVQIYMFWQLFEIGCKNNCGFNCSKYGLFTANEDGMYTYFQWQHIGSRDGTRHVWHDVFTHLPLLILPRYI